MFCVICFIKDPIFVVVAAIKNAEDGSKFQTATTPNNQITQGDVSSHYVQQQLTTSGTNADGRPETTPNNSVQQQEQQNAIMAGAVGTLTTGEQ